MVTEQAAVFRDVFEHPCQCRHVQHDLTGVIVLPNKSLAKITRCILESPDKTHLCRLFAEAPWRAAAIKGRRIRCRRHQTKPPRRRRGASLLALDETRCEHVGSLFDDVDRHDNHRAGTSPLAPHPVTSWSVRGPVRFPVALRRYRRSEEWTPWEAYVAKHGPDRQIPTARKGRNRRHQQGDSVLLQAPECRGRHEPFRTNMARAIAWVEEAIRHKVPVGVVVFAAWYLAEDLVRVLTRRHKDGISLLNTNRGLETASFQRRASTGWAMKLPSPPMAVEDRVPLIPATASRPVTVGAPTYWCCTRRVRLPTLGQVRLVVRVAREAVTGRHVVLVTHRGDCSAAHIIRLYGQRWPTETFDQDGQGHLGFNAYRRRSAEAIGKHGCLLFVAYALLHLTCLPTVSDRTTGLIHTMGDACRPQGRAVLQKLLVCVHDRLSDGATVDQVFAQFFAKQRGRVFV